jgi:intein/homing endonuclease
MAKTKKQSIGDLINDIQTDVNHNVKKDIPDIVTFVESREWLGLPYHPTNPLQLFPMQKIMLKTFYRGTLGNENLELTESEKELIEQAQLDEDDKGNFLEKYENGELFRELVLVWGRRCLSEDTTIINPKDGSLNTIGELYDKEIKKIDSWTYDEDQNEMVKIEDAEIIFQGKRDCYELITNSGHKIECTLNHPFLTQRGWVQLKDIEIENDMVSICEEIPFFGKSKEINEDEAALLGYMTADGNCSQRSTFFTCDNKEILQDLTNRLNSVSNNLKIFNDPWTKARSKKHQYKITSEQYVNKTEYCEKRKRNFSRRDKNDLVKLLEKWELMGKTCHYKTVPLELFRCPKNVISSYLKALFSCDGNLNTRRNKKLSTCEFTTVNKEQAQLIQQLLHKFGIISYLRKKKVVSKIIDEKKILREYNTFCYIVYFSRKKYLRIFLDEIGFIGKDKYINDAEKKLFKIDEKIKTNHLDDHPFGFYKVKNIENIGKKRTFDLSVSHKKSLQNFVAQGFITHNSGKDFIVSIIALYEAMKLLECEGGDPYRVYELSSANTINILTVANSKPQANLAFSEIREKIYYSEYFKDKYMKDGLSAGSIFLLTPQDKINNKEFKEKGLPQRKGSIGIIVGHSNSDSLLGMGCIVLILDEVASYKQTGGSSSGDRIYAALTPTVQTYVRKIYARDENGEFVENEHGQKVIQQRIYDGKIISISSPRAKEGKFYELFNNAKNLPTRLSMRLATWDVSPYHTRESLRSDNNTMSETEFNMEFGAEFSGTGLESFFTEDQVKSCFVGNNLKNVSIGSPGKVYFVHLDPATSSHNYALAVVHKEYFLNQQTRKADFKVIVDHIKYWQPINGAINPNEVMHYVINLKRRFHIGLITYDAFTSQESILKMRKAGIPNKETKFLPTYKFAIYKELENLINTGRLSIPYDNLLYNEMIELQRKFTPTGFKVLPKQEGDGVKSDDVVDCIAGACYIAVERQVSRLPQSRVVDLGNPGGNQIVWRNMQGGIYGVGGGKQVANSLENRSRLYGNLQRYRGGPPG